MTHLGFGVPKLVDIPITDISVNLRTHFLSCRSTAI